MEGQRFAMAAQRTVKVGLVYTIQLDAFPHLFDLEQDQAGFRVSVPVVLDEKRKSLLFPVIGHVVPRRLWDEEDGNDNNETSERLQDQGYPP
jgi:hypothetical protein